jgi:hypothetical protein
MQGRRGDAVTIAELDRINRMPRPVPPAVLELIRAGRAMDDRLLYG